MGENNKKYPFWLWAAAASYFLVFSFLSIAKHEAFNSTAYDLGIYDQVMWKYSRFEAPYSTILGINHLGDHFSPILIALVPLYWIRTGVYGLLILQSLAVSLGAFPLYRLTVLFSSSPGWSKFIIASYVLNGYLHKVLLFDFHPILFEIPFVLAMIVSLEDDRPRRFWVILPLLLITEDDSFVSALSVGLYAFLRGKRRTAVMTWAVSLAYGVTLLQFVQPWINQGHLNPHTERYAHWGGDFLGILFHMASHPWGTCASLVSGPKVGALLGFLAMPAFLPLLGGWTALLLVPPLSVEFLSSYPQQHLLRNQYAVPALAFLHVSSIYGTSRLKDKKLITVVRIALILIPLTQIPSLIHTRLSHWPWNGHAAQGRLFLARVPRDSSIAAQSVLVPHLSQREVIQVLPEKGRAEYVLADTQGNPFPMTREEFLALVNMLPHSYSLVAGEGGFSLWKRR